MSKSSVSRKSFLGKITGSLLGFGIFAQLAVFIRSLVPNVLYEPSRRFKIGRPEDFQGGVAFLPERRVYIFREGNAFHAITAVCTHLGCTVKHSPYSQPRDMTIRGLDFTLSGEFKCPCHGSAFYEEGTNYDGPAPKPLQWHHIEIAPEDGQLVVDLNRVVDRKFSVVV